MLQERTQYIAHLERQRRIWYVIIGIIFVISIGLMSFVAIQIIARSPREISAGQVSDYMPLQPKRFEVERLSVRALSRKLPEGSEDIIYVFRQQDGTWHALLGLDLQTGCFLRWNEPTHTFIAPNDSECLGSHFTPEGTYAGGAIIDPSPRPLAKLHVEIRDENVIVSDRLIQEQQK